LGLIKIITMFSARPMIRLEDEQLISGASVE